jgi:hypothetical protein
MLTFDLLSCRQQQQQQYANYPPQGQHAPPPQGYGYQQPPQQYGGYQQPQQQYGYNQQQPAPQPNYNGRPRKPHMNLSAATYDNSSY